MIGICISCVIIVIIIIIIIIIISRGTPRLRADARGSQGAPSRGCGRGGPLSAAPARAPRYLFAGRLAHARLRPERPGTPLARPWTPLTGTPEMSNGASAA